MLKHGLKKFYKEASFEELPNSLYRVLLDSRELKTPNKNALNCSKKVAEAVAKEWNEQKEEINPKLMPVTKLVNTALDRVASRRDEIIAELSSHAENDMLFYRVEEPEGLYQLQEEKWGEILGWFESKIGSKFMTTSGILPVKQSKEAIKKIEALCKELDDLSLTLVYVASANMHSTILALALYENKIDEFEAFDLSRLEENWQIAEWGEDWEAKDRRDILKAELASLKQFNLLIK